MAQRTSYSIQATFKSGLKKRWGLTTAWGTFKYWDDTIDWLDLFDDTSLKDAKRLLGLARERFELTFKIVKMVTKRETLDI